MSNKRKVLHVVGKMHPGGIESLLMNVYRHIDRRQYEFHFAVQSSEPAFYDDEIRELGGKLFVQPPPSQGLAAFRRTFEENVRRNGSYDAIHSHVFGFSGYILKLAKGLGIPVRIGHSHNTNDSKQTSLQRRIYRMYMRVLMRRNATRMLGCSRDACESLFGRQCWHDGRVDVFPNAIPLSPFAALPIDRTLLRSRFGAEQDDCLIGHIGRFSPQKNHALLLDAFAQFVLIRPNARLLLAGDGPLRPEMERKAKALGLEERVRFLGLRSDIPELLGTLDAFVLPSLYEGLGIVLIEAQAAGVPCLVSSSVPKEADLSLGMLQKLGTDESPQRWAEAMDGLVGMHEGVPTWNEREFALGQHGYDIRVATAELERMYEG
ncbi:glycosyltransferase EpsF [Paenibacillus cellulosilyticus]|uniref:Glycosyltransferase EpsF n=1 Tax=Paenibacillus cellulosilyticus TaxID=375489 RepID=A0A2V2Z381_9BACL|nr:glycosyltransferase family 1 protein [Paenibacillus cellulosilyticus]PWW07545.1 glycosyltransferase EpsF [Paenibacillus cellulosilyticus]QKS44306.1 glycosyltransferase family 1 protein [Paenibacillus cellulosilyticus]